MNKSIDTVPRFPRKDPPFKVFFTWEIWYECNYRCTYCHAPKPRDPNVPKAKYPGLEGWIQIWERIYEDYEECEMVISGGEPFLYPDFMKIAHHIAKMHILEFCTNLYFDVKLILDNVSPDRVRIGTSFHPAFTTLECFIKKINLLKDRGFETWTNFVPWPPFLKQMQGIKDVFDSNGVKLVLQPFIGRYAGREYPRGYTDDEKRLLGIFADEANSRAMKFKTSENSNQIERLCRMGENYAFIHPDGEAERCCKDHTFHLGNVIDGTFRLLEEPAPCHVTECNCWRWMSVGEEFEWTQFWGRPERR